MKCAHAFIIELNYAVTEYPASLMWRSDFEFDSRHLPLYINTEGENRCVFRRAGVITSNERTQTGPC
jgi:hypothetical protein